MPQLIDISEWEELYWFSTGGTRAKRYLQNEVGDRYYFKQSYKREVIDYKYEFWSEIIASEVGKLFGFDMLQYDLAVGKDMIGCISRSMITTDGHELNEGGKYLQAFDNEFQPDIKSTRSQYSFQLVDEAFEAFGLDEYMDRFVYMLVFDALIGNSDRHQENWAFITSQGRISGLFAQLERNVKEPFYRQLPRWIKNLYPFKKVMDEEKGTLTEEARIIKLYFQNVESFSPIYDSGSSLGRELSDEKVRQMLTNNLELDAYLRKGKSEVHWDGSKLNHFDLLSNILETSYAEITYNRIQQIVEDFDGTKIEAIVNSVDKQLPDAFRDYGLPDDRKELIIKMITLRSEKLKRLIYEGV
jgi:hypothetical protein